MKIVLIVMLFLSPLLSAQSTSIKELTMEAAVQRSVEHSPDIEALAHAVQAKKWGARSEIAGYLPTINLTSIISRENDQGAAASTTSLSADQLVYSFAGPLQRHKQAKKFTQISELDRQIQSNLVRLETEKAFLQAWYVQEQKKLITSKKRSIKSTFQRQQEVNRQGLLDKDDWLKNVEEYAVGAADVEQYNDDVAIAYHKLEFLMGESMSLLTKNESDESLVVPEVKLRWRFKNTWNLDTLSLYQQYAQTYRPEIKQGSKRMDVEFWNMKLAQGTRLPLITAGAQAGAVVSPNNYSVITPTPVEEVGPSNMTGSTTLSGFWSLNLSFKWNLFDGLVNQFKERQAEADRVKEMLNRDQTILRIRQEVHERYHECVKAHKKLKAQKMSYLRNENTYKLMQQNYELGNNTAADLATASTNWEQAQLDWLGANVRVAVAHAELAWACGYPKML